MAQLFNFIPGSGLIAPGIFFELNSAGQYQSKSRGLVLGHKSSAGSLADNALTLCSTIEEAALLAGPGSQLYETFRLARQNAPVQELWVAAVPVTGTPGAWTLTLSAMAAAGGDGVFEISGRKIALAVGPSEAVNTTATNLAAAINAYVDPLTKAYLPVTATVATNVVTVTARHAGTTMNEIELTTDPNLPGNIFAGKIAVAATVPATGTASVSAALAALGDEPFDWIISPFGETTNLDAAQAALSDVSGRWAWNIQLYGHYFTVNTGNTGANTTYGLARNDRHITALARVAAPTPSWEMLAAYVARQLPWLADDTNGNAARNMSDLVLEGIRPPRDRSLWPNYAVRNTLLGSSMSTWKVNGAGQVAIDKCVTMQRTNAAGQPDSVFRSIQTIAIAMHSLRYMRAGLSYRNANKGYAQANPANLPSIATDDDIKVDCIALHRDLVNRGLLVNNAEFARRLRVGPDTSNPARCNIGMDLDGVDPLDIIAANASFYGQYPAAA
ncbi:phage tail sheath subtilisin-like domain-containing protein [Bosea sp. BK604]|uniref:phage tail sheath subtilisin-like domain-containing protein n=1 Tax=Bosea sp. BK604 TaxID=2512180 RepID=UPI001053ECD1|nr:phage tail sheath subtilisin-like domain-containing protein [Bosea sp. BK604]TCR69693.1 phage tail sheath gpL-like [Bosea sp. BK604]